MMYRTEKMCQSFPPITLVSLSKLRQVIGLNHLVAKQEVSTKWSNSLTRIFPRLERAVQVFFVIIVNNNNNNNI